MTPEKRDRIERCQTLIEEIHAILVKLSRLTDELDGEMWELSPWDNRASRLWSIMIDAKRMSRDIKRSLEKTLEKLDPVFAIRPLLGGGRCR